MTSVFLQRNHLFLRDPHSGVEDVRAMGSAGFGAVFCNIGDFDVSEWQTIRARASAVDVICGPWLRTADPGDRFDPVRFHKLLAVADAWGSPLIVNAESELQGTGAELTSYIDAQLGARDAAISMEPWPYDNVQWWPLANRPMLPQLAKSVAPYTEQGLRDIWHDYGIKCVVMTFGSFGGSRPPEYELLEPYGVYTADDCVGNYASWAPVGVVRPCLPGPDPPPEPEEPMKIGPDHGITAACNRLRDLDAGGTLLRKSGGKWPSINTLTQPVHDWKAYDKLERTLTILTEDHDNSVP